MMEETSADAQKSGHATEDSSSNNSNKDGGLSSGNGSNCAESKSKGLVRQTKSQHTLILKVEQLQRSRRYNKQSFL